MRNRKAKIIYKAYKTFYGKEPNFSKENFMNLTIEIQAMAYILNRYGVSIGADGFCYEYEDLNMPMSMAIQDVIVGKLIGNSDDLSDASLQFSKFAEKRINIIASGIKCAINNSENQIEELRKIINILYVREFVRPSASDKEIIETAQCTQKALTNIEKLIDFIDQETCKNNFDESNAENVRKMIDEEEVVPYGMFINESGNGKLPKITKESRKKLAKSLINRN